MENSLTFRERVRAYLIMRLTMMALKGNPVANRAMANVESMSAELITGIIVVAFIFALVPIVQVFIDDANLTGASATLASLVPFILVAVGILVVVGLIRHARS